MATKLAALVACSVAFGAQAVDAAPISEARIKELMASRDRNEVTLETLRSRDREILVELGAALAKKHGVLLEGSEMVFTRLSMDGTVFYRMDFVNLRNKDRARALCQLLDIENCVALGQKGQMSVLHADGDVVVSALGVVEDTRPFEFATAARSSNPMSDDLEMQQRQKVDPLKVFPLRRPNFDEAKAGDLPATLAKSQLRPVARPQTDYAVIEYFDDASETDAAAEVEETPGAPVQDGSQAIAVEAPVVEAPVMASPEPEVGDAHVPAEVDLPQIELPQIELRDIQALDVEVSDNDVLSSPPMMDGEEDILDSTEVETVGHASPAYDPELMRPMIIDLPNMPEVIVVDVPAQQVLDDSSAGAEAGYYVPAFTASPQLVSVEKRLGDVSDEVGVAEPVMPIVIETATFPAVEVQLPVSIEDETQLPVPMVDEAQSPVSIEDEPSPDVARQVEPLILGPEQRIDGPNRRHGGHEEFGFFSPDGDDASLGYGVVEVAMLGDQSRFSRSIAGNFGTNLGQMASSETGDAPEVEADLGVRLPGLGSVDLGKLNAQAPGFKSGGSAHFPRPKAARVQPPVMEIPQVGVANAPKVAEAENPTPVIAENAAQPVVEAPSVKLPMQIAMSGSETTKLVAKAAAPVDVAPVAPVAAAPAAVEDLIESLEAAVAVAAEVDESDVAKDEASVIAVAPISRTVALAHIDVATTAVEVVAEASPEPEPSQDASSEIEVDLTAEVPSWMQPMSRAEMEAMLPALDVAEADISIDVNAEVVATPPSIDMTGVAMDDLAMTANAGDDAAAESVPEWLAVAPRPDLAFADASGDEDGKGVGTAELADAVEAITPDWLKVGPRPDLSFSDIASVSDAPVNETDALENLPLARTLAFASDITDVMEVRAEPVAEAVAPEVIARPKEIFEAGSEAVDEEYAEHDVEPTIALPTVSVTLPEPAFVADASGETQQDFVESEEIASAEEIVAPEVVRPAGDEAEGVMGLVAPEISGPMGAPTVMPGFALSLPTGTAAPAEAGAQPVPQLRVTSASKIEVELLGSVSFNDQYARPASVDFAGGRDAGRLQKLPRTRPDLTPYEAIEARPAMARPATGDLIAPGFFGDAPEATTVTTASADPRLKVLSDLVQVKDFDTNAALQSKMTGVLGAPESKPAPRPVLGLVDTAAANAAFDQGASNQQQALDVLSEIMRAGETAGLDPNERDVASSIEVSNDLSLDAPDIAVAPVAEPVVAAENTGFARGPSLIDRITPEEQARAQHEVGDLRIELSYVGSRDEVMDRVRELKKFFPPVMLEKGRFYGASVPYSEDRFVVGIEANSLKSRDDLVWYMDQMGVPWVVRPE